MITESTCRDMLLARATSIGSLLFFLSIMPTGSKICFFITGDRRRVKTKDNLEIEKICLAIEEAVAKGEGWTEAFRSAVSNSEPCDLPVRISKVLMVAHLPAESFLNMSTDTANVCKSE